MPGLIPLITPPATVATLLLEVVHVTVLLGAEMGDTLATIVAVPDLRI